MEIIENKIPIRDIVNGYVNDDENGVTALDDNLDIRPKYQREFVYKEAQRNEVIRTVMKGLPLNVMYWVDRGEEYDDSEFIPRYEVLDGQQRTISICEYIEGNFSVDGMFYHNLPNDIKEKILDYKLFIYICSGTDSEKLDWFKVINISGERLTDQELRNAVYAGSWVSSAKSYFSKTRCPADLIGNKYLKGSSIRQEYLETALYWLCSAENISIEEYMGKHQNDASAVQLWTYFQAVIEWVKAIFPKARKEMKGLSWGLFYNDNKDRTDLNPIELEYKIQRLMGDEDVTRKSGIYEYILYNNERALSIRTFDDRTKHEIYEAQGHKCAICGEEFEYNEMHGDHIIPWSNGGHTVKENCQMLCRDCNLKKSNK